MYLFQQRKLKRQLVFLNQRPKKRKEIRRNDENNRNRKQQVRETDRRNNIYCPLSLQRTGEGDHAGEDKPDAAE